MNRSYRLIWSDRLNTYTVAAETTRGQGKRVVHSVAAALLSAATGLSHAQSVAPPAPAQLPTGGKVVAGQASIAQSSQAGARLDINQSSNRAAIDWQTFNLGSKAQVNFNQPGSQSVTLNRVLDTQASQIYGRITANGQVFLTNPNGVYFSPSASVAVGGLAATTHGISNADFMAGKATFTRSGATGAVVNQGNLNASIGGYIALLAPEVRNEGVIVAHTGTVALAAGDAITLNISGANTLAGISVTPSQINTLVENKHAIFAPGGLVILSAQAAGQLQGGVVKNSGVIEASGISQRAGRIVLDASHTLTQTSTGLVDVSGSTGGNLVLKAEYDINLGGNVRAVAAEGAGGSVAVIAPGAVAVQALVDVSGAARGGSVQIQAIPTAPSGPQSPRLPVSRSTVALLSGAQISASSSRGQGGTITIEGEYVRLAEGALIDARGATGGGTVLVGGDWQGSGTLYQSTKTIQERGATIDASATIHGDGGKVVLWSDVRNQNSETIFNGVINAGGAGAGKNTSMGGRVETSGHRLAVSGAVNAGKGGQWLLDPFDVIISNGFSSNMDANFVAQGSPAVLLVTTLENALTTGTDVTVSTGPVGNFGVEAGNITLDANLRPGAMANDATLTLKADRSIIINAGYSIDATLNGNSSRLNVVLQANASDLGSGGIEMGSNTAIKSNGGNIILGGSSNLTTGYATGVGTNSNGRGIWLKDGTLLNAGGGDITLRGLGRAGGEGIVLGDGGVAGAGNSVLITESSGNITLNGVGTTAAAGGTPSGINLHNDVLIQAERGSVRLTGNGGATLNASTDNSGIFAGPGTRILSGSGPITLEGTVGTGVSTAGSGIRFASATNYLGHDEGVNLADSSSNITLTADALNAAGSNTFINTTGMLTLQPSSASFNDVFTWSGTMTGKSFTGSGSINGLIINGLDVIAGITLGKPGNTAGITFASPFTLNGQLSLIGGDIQITHPLTIYSNALVITNSGTFSTGDGVTITAEGGISQNGTGFNSIGGDIITLPASMSFARELQIRSSATLRAGGNIILGDAVIGMAPGGAGQLTLDSSAGNISLNGAVTNFAQLTLTAAGIALQSAPIQVSSLLLNGIGDYVLTNADNRIGTLAANVNGAINLTNNAPLTIGAVNGVNGVFSTNGTVQIETLSTHALAVNQAVSGSSLNLLSGGDLTVNASVTATTGDMLLSTGGVFANTVGPNVLTTPGRWLVYSKSAEANAFGGLASGNTGIFGTRLADYSPADITSAGYTGNRYVFLDLPPAIVVTTMNATSVYGDTPISLGSYFSVAANTYGGAIAAPTVTGVPVISSGGASVIAPVGSYTITADVSAMSADVPGYSFIAANTGTLGITPRPLSLTGGRGYDATTNIAATLLTLGNIVNGDTVNLSGTGILSSKNTGIRTLGDVGTLAVSNSNYTAIDATAAVNITPAVLTIGGVTANNKIYDASSAATVSGTAQISALASDVVSVAGSVLASFTDKNVGSNKAVSVSGYTLQGADAGNYSVQQPTGLTASISPATLVVSGVTANNKIYDASSAATVSGTAQISALASDVVSVAGSVLASFTDKNVGSNKAVSVSGYTLQGADAGNYSVQQPTGLTASISPATLVVSGVTANNKIYDASSAATVSGTAQISALASDVVSVAGSVLASFTDKNVGSNKAVSVSGYTLQGADAGNYSVQQPTGLTASISPATLVVSGVTANNKIYDASSAATVSGTAQISALASDVVSVAGSVLASFTDKNVGSNKAVSVSGYTLQGADAGNYSVQQPTGLTASISPATLVVSGVTANNKIYDASSAATVSGTAQISALASDVVSVAGSVLASFTDKNVGSNKAVSVSGYTLQGADAGNYSVQQPTGLTASISPATLVVSGVTANNKIYDASSAATVSGTAQISALASDVVSVAGSVLASFTDKNVGSNKAVSVSGYTLQGADAGNYSVQQPTGLTASISPATLVVSGVTANNKIYDASSAATVSGTAQISALASDVVSVAGSVLASFTDKNVGSNKAVSVSGYTLQGADAGNYSVQQPTGLTASISPATLVVSGVTANNKIYDASSAATVSGTAQISALASDVVSVAGSVLASFTDKNVGSNKAVSVSGYTLQGADAGNYSVQQPSGLTADIIASPAAPGTAPATSTTTPITTSTSNVTATTITNSAIPLPPLLETTRNLSVLRNIPSGGTLDTSGLAALITGGVSITQINDLPAPAAGEVSIVAVQADTVPPNLWHFPLPLKLISLLDTASAPDVKATLLDYSPLPVWLRFDYDNKTFVTSALPPDALPVGVLLAVGERRAVVRIVAGPSKRVAVNAPVD